MGKTAVRFHRSGLPHDSERGAVTAEFAITLPVVVFTLALILSGTTLAAQRIVAATAAGQIALHEARGDTDKAGKIIANLPRHAEVSRSHPDGLHCVTVKVRLGAGPLQALKVHSRSCAVPSEDSLADSGATGDP